MDKRQEGGSRSTFVSSFRSNSNRKRIAAASFSLSHSSADFPHCLHANGRNGGGGGGGRRRPPGEREREGGQEIGIPGAARIRVTHCATSISREVEGKSPSILSHKCAHAGVICVKKKTMKSNEKLENPCGKWCKRTKRQKGTNFLPM